MNRESDEECLKLIASIRDRAAARVSGPIRDLYASSDQLERLLDNLEARIEELVRLHSRDGQTLRELAAICAERDSLRSELAGAREKIERLRPRKMESEAEGAIRFRDIIREEVATEVSRQLGTAYFRCATEVGILGRELAARAQEAEAS